MCIVQSFWLTGWRDVYLDVKRSVSRDFLTFIFSWFEPFGAPDKQAKIFSNLVSISPRYSITMLSPRCVAHCRFKSIFLVNQYVILQIFSFMIDVLTPKRIYPDCPCKSNHRQGKISVLTSRCAVCLCGVKHTTKIVSAMRCTPRRSSPCYCRMQRRLA